MKKLLSLMLAVVLVFSMAVVASAETTTLTTNVPAATYTLNIPIDQEIAFGATKTNIGNVTVTNSQNFAEGKNVDVTVSYTSFSNALNNSTIPFTISGTFHRDVNGGQSGTFEIPNNGVLTFKGTAEGIVREVAKTEYTNGSDYIMDYLNINILSTDWGKALGGEYTATIVFASEVVVE